MNSGANSSKTEQGLALVAESEHDLNIISALTQDGLSKRKNIRWQKKRHRFSLLINRFRWELVSEISQETVPFGRCQTMLAFDGVIEVSSLGVKQYLEDQILSLLRVELVNKENYNEIKLIFSGKAIIMLKTEFLYAILQDLNRVGGLVKGRVPRHRFGIDQ